MNISIVLRITTLTYLEVNQFFLRICIYCLLDWLFILFHKLSHLLKRWIKILKIFNDLISTHSTFHWIPIFIHQNVINNPLY